MIDAGDVPVTNLVWPSSHRLIPSRYPTVGLFDAIADPADLDVVFAIEALTNPRLRDEVGELQLVPPEERVSGQGSTPIMAAFTHLNPDGSRYSDGSYGVYYAADTLETALAEVSHHRAVFMRRTNEAAMDIDMRLIVARVQAPMHDLREMMAAAPELYERDSYAAPQRLGMQLRNAGSWGVCYGSVRHAGGHCVGVFRPRALSHARPKAHIALHWDGERITHWYEKRDPRSLNNGR